MSDPALDKLIEEIRINTTRIAVLDREWKDLKAELKAVSDRREAADRRADLLDLTLRRHVYDAVPVVQAKLIAHEEVNHEASIVSALRGKSSA